LHVNVSSLVPVVINHSLGSVGGVRVIDIAEETVISEPRVGLLSARNGESAVLADRDVGVLAI